MYVHMCIVFVSYMRYIFVISVLYVSVSYCTVPHLICLSSGLRPTVTYEVEEKVVPTSTWDCDRCRPSLKLHAYL